MTIAKERLATPTTDHNATSALAKPAALAALVTVIVYLPQLLTDTDEMSELGAALNLAWAISFFAAAPAVAAIVTRRARLNANARRSVLIGLPQLVVAVLLTRLDVWFEVRSGYLLAESGEEAMAYGAGTVVGVVAGLVLTALVAVAVKTRRVAAGS